MRSVLQEITPLSDKDCFYVVDRHKTEFNYPVHNGEWFWGVHPDGTPDKESPKAGFWKCPYHNTRMCLQVIHLLG